MGISYFSFLTNACIENETERKKELGYFSSPFVNACTIPEIIVNIRSIAYYEVMLAKGFGKIRSNSNFQEFFDSYFETDEAQLLARGNGLVTDARPAIGYMNPAGYEEEQSEYSLPEVVAVGFFFILTVDLKSTSGTVWLSDSRPFDRNRR